MYEVEPQSFLEIPASLVEQMLQKTNEIGGILQSSIHEINRKRQKFRLQLEQTGLLDNDIRFRNIDQLISGGVDGAYAVDRLLGTDLLFAAAVAVNGMNEENGKRSSQVMMYCQSEKHNQKRSSKSDYGSNGNQISRKKIYICTRWPLTPHIHMYQATVSLKLSIQNLQKKSRKILKIF